MTVEEFKEALKKDNYIPQGSEMHMLGVLFSGPRGYRDRRRLSDRTSGSHSYSQSRPRAVKTGKHDCRARKNR